MLDGYGKGEFNSTSGGPRKTIQQLRQINQTTATSLYDKNSINYQAMNTTLPRKHKTKSGK